MNRFDLKGVDLEIAKFYAPLIFNSINYGENQVNVWFPGSGKTTITKDILSDISIIKTVLGKLTDNIKFVFYSCDLAESRGALNVLKGIANSLGINKKYDDLDDLTASISNFSQKFVFDKGKELVFIGNKLEDLDTKEQEKLLSAISKIVATNQRRIHSIINSEDINLIKSFASKKLSLLGLLNRIKFMPVISKKLLDSYVDTRIKDFNQNIDSKNISRIKKSSGGILLLTKEGLRSFPETEIFMMKLKNIWDNLPKNYKEVIKKRVYGDVIQIAEELQALKELEKLDIISLTVFKDNFQILERDVKSLFLKNAKNNEKKLFEYFQKNKGKLICKDDINNVIWGEDENSFASDWAIDQLISRFRKTLIKFNIDSKSLKTIKGKGYIWKG